MNLSTMANKIDKPKRYRRTNAQIAKIHEQIIEALVRDHPQSVRHVLYLMTNPTLPEPVEKTERGYKHVQREITKLRRAGRIPYYWITDATRRGYYVPTYPSAGDFVASVAGQYRGQLWNDVEHYVEVWCESRSIAGVIEDTCKELAVSLYPAGGFSSISLVYKAADLINSQVSHEDKPAEIIYIDDYDPAGVLIDQSIHKELLEHLHPSVELNMQRIAITEEQIETHGLPTKPRKSSDRRALHIRETVEAEAMPARMLRDKVESYLPEGALEAVKAAEESERDGLELLAEAIKFRDAGDIAAAAELIAEGS